MKHIAIKLVVFLLLGAVVNVGVAWGCANRLSDSGEKCLQTLPRRGPRRYAGRDQITPAGWRIDMRDMTIAALTVLTIGHLASAGGVLFVDDDAAGGGDGLTWDTAYRFLQDAITFAAEPGNGVGEIRVAQGIYKPDRDEANPDGTGARAASFRLVTGVAVLGGYAGLGERDPDARDIQLYTTTLSGDLAGNDGPDFKNNNENSHHIVMDVSTAESPRLDGFTVMGGWANQPALSIGGGFAALDGSAEIQNCNFVGNAADNGGGAIGADDGTVTITNCAFTGNVAVNTFGGGILSCGADVVVSSCEFTGNSAAVRGGAFYAQDACDVFLLDCSFSANSVPDEGGAVSTSGQVGFVSVLYCDFEGNTTGETGGAIRIGNQSDALLVSCTFLANVSGDLGGAMYNGSPSAFIVNCRFLGNHADDGGGALHNQMASPTIVNCLFSGNTAGVRGAGLHNRDSSHPQVVNCTLSGNESSGTGGGIFNEIDSAPAITNCILWGNTDRTGATESAQVGADDAPAPTVNYCCIENLSGDLGGVGNIGVKPLFVDPNGVDGVIGTADDDYHLQRFSPCIDSGLNAVVPDDEGDLDNDEVFGEITPLDLDGNPRFADDVDSRDVGCGLNAPIDMGSFEFPGPATQPVRGDIDGDLDVDTNDLILLLGAWGECQGCCVADVNGDITVNATDLMILLSNWG